jgi:citronellol/citronellal dehydrogenase
MDEPHAKAVPTDAEFATHPTVYAADALKGQIAMVSGGSGGIGRAIAWLFARLGAHVVVVGRNQPKLDALVENLTARNLKATAAVADIRQPDAINALFDLV